MPPKARCGQPNVKDLGGEEVLEMGVDAGGAGPITGISPQGVEGKERCQGLIFKCIV